MNTSAENVVYEIATTSHLKQILDIERLCFSAPWSEASYAAEFSDERAHYLVALSGGGVIGFCGYWDIVEEGHIINIAVHPDHQGMGVGAGLLGRLLEYAGHKGIGSFTLEVREDNIPAIKLYEKFGFVAEGLRKNYYQKEKKHAIIMWKR